LKKIIIYDNIYLSDYGGLILMNVYDFDNTIYSGDSSFDFYMFCLKRNPKIITLANLQLTAMLDYKRGKCTRTEMKQKIYKYLKYVKDIDNAIKEFWNTHEKNIKGWYYKQKRDDDLIISASPEFLLAPICRKLNVELMGSRLDKVNGIYDGEHCYEEEKPRRFFEKYPDISIDEFYSDSYSDTPLAKLAAKAFIVKGNRISEWDFGKYKK